jgi:hypothetical protein
MDFAYFTNMEHITQYIVGQEKNTQDSGQKKSSVVEDPDLRRVRGEGDRTRRRQGSL